MSGQRLTELLQLVFTTTEEGTPSFVAEGDAEPVVAKCEPERPAVTNSLMEAVCERENLKKALRCRFSEEWDPSFSKPFPPELFPRLTAFSVP